MISWHYIHYLHSNLWALLYVRQAGAMVPEFERHDTAIKARMGDA